MSELERRVRTLEDDVKPMVDLARAIEALKAERDRLREIHVDQSEQIQRLRAALEEIIKWEDSYDRYDTAVDMARRALEGK
jgi:hypothetical protein